MNRLVMMEKERKRLFFSKMYDLFNEFDVEIDITSSCGEVGIEFDSVDAELVYVETFETVHGSTININTLNRLLKDI